jgi:hypothetical protein
MQSPFVIARRWIGNTAAEDYRWLSRPLIAFIASQILLLAVGYMGYVQMPHFVGRHVEYVVPQLPLLDMWARWDSFWFQRIVNDGYFFTPGLQSSVAFFPLYPMATKVVTLFTAGNSLVAGWLVSNLAFLAALVVMYQLALLEFRSRRIADLALLFTCLYPTAFFFRALYSESLYLLLALGAFYAARRGEWLWAGVCGVLLAATRLPGVTIVLPLTLEWLRAHGWTLRAMFTSQAWRNAYNAVLRDWKMLVPVLIIPFGLLAYMLYQAAAFGNPFAFLETQAMWGQSMRGPIAAITSAFNDYFTPIPRRWQWYIPLNLGTFFFTLAMLPFIWRRLGASYGVFTLLAIGIPIMSTTGSMSRFTLVAFPVYLLLAAWAEKRRWLQYALVAFGVVSVSFLTMLFATWYFIA